MYGILTAIAAAVVAGGDVHGKAEIKAAPAIGRGLRVI